MTHKEVAWLLFRHQRNELTLDEQMQLDNWLNEAPANRERFNNCYTNAVWMRKELTAFRNINVAAGKRKADLLIRKHRIMKIVSYTGVAIIIVIAFILLLN
jgi:hypothetical protein